MSTEVAGQANGRLNASEREFIRDENERSGFQQNGHTNTGDPGSEDNAQKEKGEKGPPASVGFWDPRLKHVRREAFSKWILTTIVLMFFIMGVLSICKQFRPNTFESLA